MKKRILIMSSIILFIGIFAFVLCDFFHLIPHQKYTNEFFGIETYHSQVDRDQDGIEDQKDILESVKSYISTHPKYESKYYATGYPDDNKGVCTDVVAFGLLGAGYDIKELLNQDVLAHPEQYDIDVVDKNIDFRRVLNLNTYFQNHAISLTTDLSQYSQWQGGDIVVFKKHIAVVSDHRNKKKIPFLIHHANPLQIYYEEDILEQNQNDIIGHYRIS